MPSVTLRRPPAWLARARTPRPNAADASPISNFAVRRRLATSLSTFVCFSARLIVELDGSQHAAPEQATFDARRDAYFKAAGFRVLRITTGDFFREREVRFGCDLERSARRTLAAHRRRSSPLVGEDDAARGQIDLHNSGEGCKHSKREIRPLVSLVGLRQG